MLLFSKKNMINEQIIRIKNRYEKIRMCLKDINFLRCIVKIYNN